MNLFQMGARSAASSTTPPPAKEVMSLKQFKAAIAEDIEEGLRTQRARGRPRKTFVDYTGMDITGTSLVMIVNAGVEAITAKGLVFDETANQLYDMGDRRDFVRSFKGTITKIDMEAVADDPFDLAERMFSFLVPVGKTRLYGRSETKYLPKPTMLPLEWADAAAYVEKRGRRANQLGTKAADAARSVARQCAEGETFAEAKLRHLESIRNSYIQ
jgi:hypothetical protein